MEYCSKLTSPLSITWPLHLAIVKKLLSYSTSWNCEKISWMTPSCGTNCQHAGIRGLGQWKSLFIIVGIDCISRTTIGGSIVWTNPAHKRIGEYPCGIHSRLGYVHRIACELEADNRQDSRQGKCSTRLSKAALFLHLREISRATSRVDQRLTQSCYDP